MDILLIADIESIHTYNYIKNVLVGTGYNITLFDIKGDLNRVRKEYIQYYVDHGIKLHEGIDIDIIKQGGYFRYIYTLSKKLSTLGIYDCVHIKGVYNYLALPIYFNRNKYKKIILTYWGSDLYRSSKFMLLQTLPLVSVANKISFITDDMRTFFSKFFFFRNHLKKSSTLDYGNMFYEKIYNYKNQNKAIIKQSLGLNLQKHIVTIGYHGRPQMQQLQAINSLIEGSKINLNQIQFCFPVFGISNNDYYRLKTSLESANIDFLIFNDFMDEDTVSRFRVATDIFIHPQTSDALSCAMLEHLYAGSIVINGEWLKYSTLDNSGIYYVRFKNFDHLPIVFDKVISEFDMCHASTIENQELIARISSWKILRESWIELYQ